MEVKKLTRSYSLDFEVVARMDLLLHKSTLVNNLLKDYFAKIDAEKSKQEGNNGS